MRIQAVAWDIDGTLVDSEPLHLFALQTVCERYEVDISDLSDEHFVGVNLNGVWQALQSRYPTHLSKQQWIDELNQTYQTYSDRLSVMPHAIETVNQLHTLGIKQVAVSNSNRLIVDSNLQAVGLTDKLLFSLSLDDVYAGKPSPIPYQLAAQRLSISAKHIIAVEDSMTGLKSAKAAGLTSIGFQTQQAMVLYEADAVITDLDLLPELIISFNL